MTLEGRWGVSVTPQPLFIPGKDPVPIVQEAGWAPGLVWTSAENLAPHRDSIPGPSRLYPVAIPTTLPGPHHHIIKWRISVWSTRFFSSKRGNISVITWQLDESLHFPHVTEYYKNKISKKILTQLHSLYLNFHSILVLSWTLWILSSSSSSINLHCCQAPHCLNNWIIMLITTIIIIRGFYY